MNDFIQIIEPAIYLDQTLKLPEGLDDTKDKVQELDEFDEENIGLYAWLSDQKGPIDGKAFIGTACNNTNHKKTSLSRMKKRKGKPSELDTARVSIKYLSKMSSQSTFNLNTCF